MEIGLGMNVGRSIKGLGRQLGGRRNIAVPNPFPTNVGTAATTFVQNGSVLTITNGAQLDAKRADGLFTIGMKAVLKLTISGTGTIRVFAGNSSPTDQVVSGNTVQRTYEKVGADASFLIIRVQSATFTGTVTIDELYEE